MMKNIKTGIVCMCAVLLVLSLIKNGQYVFFYIKGPIKDGMQQEQTISRVPLEKTQPDVNDGILSQTENEFTGMEKIYRSSINSPMKTSSSVIVELSAQGFLTTWERLRSKLLSDLELLLEEGVREDDPRLLELIRRNMFPPASHKVYKLSYYMPQPRQAIAAKKYFNGKVNPSFLTHANHT